MIGRSLFCLAVFVGSLLGLRANAVTTSKNIDIIVTHGATDGATVTTSTFTNYTGGTLAAGTPISLAQGFRYGDVPAVSHPVIRDATTHAVLPHQQWDEISTWIENGGNGSWRHAVWTINLPNSLAAGASYTIEFVTASGAYSASSALALSALCSGGGAHDLKVHLTDVRNQDDTARDSGDATFRVCDNIANTGRDAPRHLRAGPVVDEYMVSGLFTYAASGNKDPLLYVQCAIDLFTDPATGSTLKDVRHVCTVFNSWENVKAGSTGNAGNPGPAGFTNDPQVISYQPQILDGSTDILDWANLTQTVSSASNPVSASGGCGSNTFQGNISMTVPGSTGNNTWFSGQAVRVSTTGTAVGGLTAGKIYWIYNCGTPISNGTVTTTNQLGVNPLVEFNGNQGALSTSQGTGTTTFTDVFWHPHWHAWQALDSSTDENWATAGSTTRFTRRVYPNLTTAEKQYWEQTGLIMPMNLSQTPTVQFSYGADLFPLYRPFARGITIGTGNTGFRPDIGFVNQFAAQAFITQAQNDHFLSRLFTMANSTHGWGVMLNEATGRIPVLNNGPPTGPGGNGIGGSYAGLGAPQDEVSWAYDAGVLTYPVNNIPDGSINWSCGIWQCQATGSDHMPGFDGYSYMLFGSRHFLDMIYQQSNRNAAWRSPGVGPSYRDDVQNGNHYWGLGLVCCDSRGSAWILRDMSFAAALGGDSNVERSYYNDQITENGNYYTQWIHFKEGPGNTQLEPTGSGIMPPNYQNLFVYPDTFMMQYTFFAAYAVQAFVHAPLGTAFLAPLQRLYEGVCGRQSAGAPPVFYCIDYQASPAIHNGDPDISSSSVGNIGTNVNGVDATDYGNLGGGNSSIGAGGQVFSHATSYHLTVGDQVKLINGGYYHGNQLIDQLPGNQWFDITGPIDNTAGTYYIKCPVGSAATSTCPTPGAAFTGFTRGGVPINGETQELLIYRLQYDPGPGVGFTDNTYTSAGGTIIYGLNILGHDTSNAICNFATQGGPAYFRPDSPEDSWDLSIAVAGLPHLPPPTCPLARAELLSD